MPIEWKSKEERYFWTGWFTGQSFALLAALYAMLSFADLYATVRLIPFGIREGNPLANWALTRFETPGFIIYKVLLVFLVLGVIKLIERHNARIAHILLWIANIAMGYVAILHIAILIATLYELSTSVILTGSCHCLVKRLS